MDDMKGFSRAVSLEFAIAPWVQRVQVPAVSRLVLLVIPAQREEGLPGRRECPSYSSASLPSALDFIVHFPSLSAPSLGLPMHLLLPFEV